MVHLAGNIMPHTTIEALSAELWFELFEFFHVIQLYRMFFGLNSRINDILFDNASSHRIVLNEEDYDFFFQRIAPRLNPITVKLSKTAKGT